MEDCAFQDNWMIEGLFPATKVRFEKRAEQEANTVPRALETPQYIDIFGAGWVRGR